MPVLNRQLTDLLGSDADSLLSYTAKGFKRDSLHLPGGDFVDRVMSAYRPFTDRAAEFQPDSQSRAAWPGPGMSRFCRWIRGSNTPPGRALPRIRSISIRKTS